MQRCTLLARLSLTCDPLFVCVSRVSLASSFALLRLLQSRLADLLPVIRQGVASARRKGSCRCGSVCREEWVAGRGHLARRKDRQDTSHCICLHLFGSSSCLLPPSAAASCLRPHKSPSLADSLSLSRVFLGCRSICWRLLLSPCVFLILPLLPASDAFPSLSLFPCISLAVSPSILASLFSGLARLVPGTPDASPTGLSILAAASPTGADGSSSGSGSSHGFVTARIGSTALIPCNLSQGVSGGKSEDFVTLVLWYKEDMGGAPMLTIDARTRPLGSAPRVPAPGVGQRVSFDLTPTAGGVLRITSLVKQDDGLYKCRVDFRRGRTVSTSTYLSVVGESLFFFISLCTRVAAASDAPLMEAAAASLSLSLDVCPDILLSLDARLLPSLSFCAYQIRLQSSLSLSLSLTRVTGKAIQKRESKGGEKGRRKWDKRSFSTPSLPSCLSLSFLFPSSLVSIRFSPSVAALAADEA